MSLYRIPIILTLAALTAASSGCLFKRRVPPPPPEAAERGLHPGLDLTDPWVLIDTKRKLLVVYKRGEAPRYFNGLALGAANAGFKKRRGDNITPIGRYRIHNIRPSGKFKIFMHLDYPSVADAQRALDEKRIDRGTFALIEGAHRRASLPPQNTSLGGLIGIHGLGRGSREIHKYANWTAGCMALDNQQISELAALLHSGVVVEIR